MGLINQLNANELGHHLVVAVYPNFTYHNGGWEDIASFRTFIIPESSDLSLDSEVAVPHPGSMGKSYIFREYRI